MAQLGFLGLGIMGYPMARHLLEAGHEVALWSHTGAKARELAAKGKGTACATPKEVAQRADFIFYCVGNTAMARAVSTGKDGLLEGVRPGSYRVRLDEMEAKSGKVSARAEVPFNVPDKVATGSVADTSKRAESGGGQQLAAAGNATVPGGSSSAVVVPKIATTTVSKGDSLWRLSQLNLGAGTRYAVIYKANKEQIRNPNLIYPGQIFVMPAK